MNTFREIAVDLRPPPVVELDKSSTPKRWTPMRPFALALAALVLVSVGAARAQETADERADTLRWHVTPYAGVFLINDDELGDVGMELDSPVFLFGARVGYRFHPSWWLEGSYGYAPLTATSEEEAGEIDGDLHVYNATLTWMAPRDARARILLSGGAGGMRYSYDEFSRRNPAGEMVQLVGTSWANELALVFGVGVEVDAGERVAVRVDARDHLQFCNEEDEPINETEDFSHCPLDSTVLANPEFTGGLVIRF